MSTFRIDCDFPGGNILVDRIDGDQVFLQQDLRDTTEWWFYWCFRIRGAQGRTVTFNFTNRNVFSVGGAAVSRDEGDTWVWLPPENFDGDGFTYSFADSEADLRFSFAMPYQRERLDRFLAAHKSNPRLVVEHHATTRKGRDNVRLRLGRMVGEPRHRVLLACRHHSCEMMAEYVLEGIFECVLGDSETGNWLADNCEFMAVPMADLDGVEDGDQGKRRAPRDHNRDYDERSLYPTVQATMAYVPEWSQGKLHLAMDLHCPWIRGGRNDVVFQVGKQPPALWQQQQIFGRILEDCRCGPLPYHCADDLPFGQEWNTGGNFGSGCSFSRWAGTLPKMKLATSFEIPYAKAHGVEVNQGSAKTLGFDFAEAIKLYLKHLNL